MTVNGQDFWTWGDTQSILMAMLVEETLADGIETTQDALYDWKVAASIDPYFAELWVEGDADRRVVERRLSRVRDRLRDRSDFTSADLADWSVLDDHRVGGGRLRVEPLLVAQVIDLLDAIEAALGGVSLSESEAGRRIYGAPEHLIRPIGITDQD